MDLRRLLVGLLVGSTLLFVVAVSVERSSADEHAEQPAATQQAGSEEGHDEEAEVANVRDSAGSESGNQREHAEEEETLLGVNRDAWPLVAAAAAVSLLLALGAWLRPRSGLLLVLIAAVMLAFTAFDVVEVVHQLEQSSAGLAVLAALVAAVHLAAGGVAATMRRHAQSPGVRPRI